MVTHWLATWSSVTHWLATESLPRLMFENWWRAIGIFVIVWLVNASELILRQVIVSKATQWLL